MPVRSATTPQVSLRSLLPVLILSIIGQVSAPVATAQPLGDGNPLVVEPKTPREIFDTALLMEKLGRPNLARAYMQQFIDQNLPDDELMALYRDVGPATFIRLQRSPSLGVTSKPVVDRIFNILRAEQNDPARLRNLIDDLMGEPAEQIAAIKSLRKAGPPVLPAVIGRLAKTGNPAERSKITYALTQMGREMIPGLLAALESDSDDVRISVLNALAYIARPENADRLLGLAFDPDENAGVRNAARSALARILQLSPTQVERQNAFGVSDRLEDLARRHFAGTVRWDTDEAGQVDLWVWNDTAETIAQVQVSPQTASLYRGTRFARQVLNLAPGQTDHRALYLALALSSTQLANGWEQPLPSGPGTVHDIALTAGPEVLLAALDLAMELENSLAAAAILRVYGQVGSPKDLDAAGRLDSALLRALDHPDPRVQFAAANVVMKLDPREPYERSQRVVDIFARTLRGEATSTALVVHPNAANLGTYGGYLRDAGFNVLTTTTGKDAFRIAASRSDIDLIAVNGNVVAWPLSMTVANLKADSRTSGIPLLIYGPEESAARMQRLTDRYERIDFVPESYTSELFLARAEGFLDRYRTPAWTGAERARNAEIAAYWLGFIANSRRTRIYDLRSAEDALFTAINSPDTASNAVIALGSIPTTSAQKRLQDVVTSSARPGELRVLAANRLAAHIQRFGLLLSKLEVNTLEALRDAEADPNLHAALSAVIGSLRPNDRLVTERLKAIPAPSLITPAPTPDPNN